MTDLIKVPYAELMQRASRIRQESESIRAELKTLKDAVESIGWIGRRAERFFATWEETKSDLESWVQILENFASELEDQGRRMQAVDEVQ